jgi:copper(I)-binding protein
MVKTAASLRAIRVLFATVLILAVTACSGRDSISVLSITDVWTRPTPSGATVAAVYLTIVSPVDDMLLSVDSPVAEKASVHQTGIETTGEQNDGHESHNHQANGSEMSMSETEIKLTAGTPVAFLPGGLHVMLEGLKTPLLEGSSIPLSLSFRSAGSQRVSVRVSTNPPG